MGMTFQLPRRASSEDPLRLAVLISGSGSGMAALLKHQHSSSNSSHITTVVISNKEGVAGLQKAIDGGVEAMAISSNSTPEREAHERLIHAILEERCVEAVILSGYMRLFTPWFVEQWEGRMLNIHPSLLPEFPGAHSHRDVIAAGAEVTGCTVHFVDSGMDSGVIISQREVPVSEDDDEESLQKKVKEIEHQLYPVVIDAFAEGRLDLDI
jgi:phosphoribosylglycinamide formyltransferase-1